MVPFVAVSLAPIRIQDHRATTYFRNQRCNPDIRRAAKLLIDQHGEDAPEEVARLVAEFVAAS